MFRGTEFIFGESEADQLAAIMENIGLPPVYMLEQSDRKHVYYGNFAKLKKIIREQNFK